MIGHHQKVERAAQLDLHAVVRLNLFPPGELVGIGRAQVEITHHAGVR